MTKTEIKHSKYDLILFELETEREQKEAYRLKYEAEKLRAKNEKQRADSLQVDLDRYDDFVALCETETARALTRKVS
jgi:hypothetical protein